MGAAAVDGGKHGLQFFYVADQGFNAGGLGQSTSFTDQKIQSEASGLAESGQKQRQSLKMTDVFGGDYGGDIERDS